MLGFKASDLFPSIVVVNLLVIQIESFRIENARCLGEASAGGIAAGSSLQETPPGLGLYYCSSIADKVQYQQPQNMAAAT